MHTDLLEYLERRGSGGYLGCLFIWINNQMVQFYQ